MKPSIVIQTDFSLKWGAVSEMKGVMKIVDPTLDIQDLCHEIKSFDPWEASLSLNTVEPYWPKGTVFVSVVDPGVGTSRKASVAKLKDGNYVVTPDNGSLTHLVHSVGVEEIREIDETVNRYQARETVSVFHGRDLFGYCAAKLAAGIISFEEVGPSYPVEDIVECEEYTMESIYGDSEINGWILSGNQHFGGIMLNIRNKDFEKWGATLQDVFHVTITNENKVYFEENVPYVPSFGFVQEGAPLLYQGSSLYISLDLNCSHFIHTYGIGTGKNWKFTLKKVKKDA